MRSQNIDRDWLFQHGLGDGSPAQSKEKPIRKVNLPHDYMIESNVREDAVAGSPAVFIPQA